MDLGFLPALTLIGGAVLALAFELPHEHARLLPAACCALAAVGWVRR